MAKNNKIPNGDIHVVRRVNGLGEADERGAYVHLVVVLDDVNHDFKVSASWCEAVGKTLIKIT